LSFSPPLLCTVRGCRRPLIRERQAFRCDRGHSFDIARDGYVNLLQPQDRRSHHAGDSREAVEARAALLHDGIGAANLRAIVSSAALPLTRTLPVVVDLGSGSGEVLRMFAELRPICGIGIDLSTAAAAHSARRARPTPDATAAGPDDIPGELTWVVANADRGLPLADASADLVRTIQGRRNPLECGRVLAECGRLLVSVPAPDDLVELREAVQGAGTRRARVEDLIRTHERWFRVVERQRLYEHHSLNRSGLENLLKSTYRGSRASQSSRVADLESLDVTLASDVVIFAPIADRPNRESRIANRQSLTR
jgi:23S rRNA (guanine745-N1)-methyltransferase